MRVSAILLTSLCFSSIMGMAHAQDAEAGESVFRKCVACHEVGEDARNRVGPALSDVVGRTAGTAADYRYSKYMMAAGEQGLVWDATNLFEYLADPSGYLKQVLDDPRAKAKMTFRLRDEDERRNVIAYLESFAPDNADDNAASLIVEDTGVMVGMQDQGLCVTNGSDHRHFFAAETNDIGRVTSMLEPGETLCAGGAAGGFVSVFEEVEGFEGCSRLVPASGRDTLLKYADFDRCAWASNT